MRTRLWVRMLNPAVLVAALLLPGCTPAGQTMDAQKALALSASALSGSERYGMAGDIAIFDPNGVMAAESRYEGEVTGHGKLSMKWSEGMPGVRERATGTLQEQPGLSPLQLLSDVEHGKATVQYADNPYSDGQVRLLVRLDDKVAKRRITQGLRAELRGLQTRLNGKALRPEQKKQAEAVMGQAERNLDQAISTLRVTTVCRWTADRDTWFPRQMREETELSYRWNGKNCRERRVAETNFQPGGS